MIHVLVADQKFLRVLETGANVALLTELAVFHNRAAAHHERDLVSDRPGRTMNGSGRVRHAFEPKVSARQQSLDRWMRLIGEPLQELLAAHDSRAVVLVASPRLLATLRARLPARVGALIRSELPRDLAKQPLNELKKRVRESVLTVIRDLPEMRPVHRVLRSKSKKARSSVRQDEADSAAGVVR